MVNYLLKKSYQLKDLKEIEFNDLWGDRGVFTTMWIFENPSKILFFKEHINNLIKSTKAFSISKSSLRLNILDLIKNNIDPKIKYNHLLRIAINKDVLSVTLRKRVKPKSNFNLKLVNLKRHEPEFKNLKYKQILKHLSKMHNSKSDIGLCSDNKIFETGTSNLIFIKDSNIYSPKSKFYKGVTYKFFKSKVKKIINKDISLNSLKEFDEIILIGSGKGVASVKTVDQIKWKRKSLKFYNILFKHYKSAINSCPKYK